MPSLMPREAPRSSALTTRQSGSAKTHAPNEAVGDRSGLKVLLGQPPRSQTLGRIVRIDGLDRLKRFLLTAEGEEPAAGGQNIAEAGVLGYHRLARGEVAGVAIAEPAAAKPNVLVFRDGELGPRLPDELRGGAEDVKGHRQRPPQPPRMNLQPGPVAVAV